MKVPVKKIWTAFNRWRKRHWHVRVVILLILLVHILVDMPILPRLVWSSMDAILAASDPPMVDAVYRSNKAHATRRLQRALMATIDEDEDGMLSRSEKEHAAKLGLDPNQLTAMMFEANLDQIAAAAQRAGLLASSRGARGIRKEAWRAAKAETDEVILRRREELRAMVVWYRVPDYLEWATWRNGITHLLRAARHDLFFTVGNPSHWIPFFVSVYLLGLITCRLFRGRRILAATVVFVVICFAGVVAYQFQDQHRVDLDSVKTIPWQWLIPRSYASWRCLIPFGYALLVLAAIVSGVRRANLLRQEGNALTLAPLALGLVLAAWGLTPGLKAALMLYPGTDFFFSYPCLMGLEITTGVRIGIVAAGGVALLLALSVAIIRKLRRMKAASSSFGERSPGGRA